MTSARTVDERTAVDRVLMGVAVVATAVLFWPAASDPVNVVKMIVLLLAAVALTVRAVLHVIRRREFVLPVGLAPLAAVVLLGAFALAATATKVRELAVLGAYGRNSGLLSYTAALVLSLGCMRAFSQRTAPGLLFALSLAGLFTSSYGLLQYVGLDAINWTNPFNPIIAALGNPNFAAAYMGLCAPAAVAGAFHRGWPVPLRAGAGATAALCLLGTVLSGSAQGPLAALAGLAVVALAVLLDRSGRVRTTGLAMLGALSLAGFALLVAGAFHAGPVAAVFADVGYRARIWYWQAAIRMWREAPVLGVGLDMYGTRWRTDQPLGAVRALGGGNFTDAAHSVPLHLLATGGAVLGAAYLLFVVAVGAALFHGLLRSRGQARLVLGGLGGAWLAYQVQSLVSIDQVPLITAHYVTAGGVVAASGLLRIRRVRLPGALPEPAAPRPTRRARPVAPAPRTREMTHGDYLVSSVVVLIGLVLAWQLLDVLRGDMALRTGDRERQAGNGNAALDAYDRAIEVAPLRSLHWQRRGDLLRVVQMPQPALTAYEAAIHRNSYDPVYLTQEAEVLEQLGRVDEARSRYNLALERDPYDPQILLAASRFELRHRGAERARSLLIQALRVLQPRADLLATLGDARAVLNDSEAARQAYRQALSLDGQNADARRGLDLLKKAS